MGFKRPFDSEEFQELPFKQARQLDYSNKLTQFAHIYKTTSQVPDLPGDYDGSFVKSQQHDKFEHNTVTGVSNLAKDVEISPPLSLVTSSSSDEDVASGVAAYSSHSPGLTEFDFPRRSAPLEDAYSSYLDHSPRRQVPLGPNHQASIPMWGRHVQNDPNSFSSFSGSDDSMYNNNEEKMMGTCIIPMPDAESSEDNSNEFGCGRTYCSCLDEGSVRCVRQHIMEAQEKLKNTLGHEKLVSLGFCDMGEEVTCKWSEEEQRVFHAVVYSNPASLGQNFWKHLSQVFASRSTKEIVSYYFNVFMLRRRAAQNRSHLLDIDSDDDELQGINRGSFKVQVSDDDDDSDIESLDQYDHADQKEDTFIEDDDDDDDDDGDGCDGDGDLGESSGDATGEDSGIDYVSEAHDIKSFDGSRFDAAVKHVNNNSGNVEEDFTVQDDSCMSFEFQADKVDSYNPVDTGAALQVSGVKSDNRDCLPGNGDDYSDAIDHVYLLDPCDARYSIPIKGVDLLPTCNIIEEIFGQGTSGD